jgi:hypothetical protein
MVRWRHPNCPIILRMWHGEKSRTPSVKSSSYRNETTVPGDLRRYFHSICVSFTRFLFFLSLSSISSCYAGFLLYFTRTFSFFWSSAFSGQRVGYLPPFPPGPHTRRRQERTTRLASFREEPRSCGFSRPNTS